MVEHFSLNTFLINFVITQHDSLTTPPLHYSDTTSFKIQHQNENQKISVGHLKIEKYLSWSPENLKKISVFLKFFGKNLSWAQKNLSWPPENHIFKTPKSQLVNS